MLASLPTIQWFVVPATAGALAPGRAPANPLAVAVATLALGGAALVMDSLVWGVLDWWGVLDRALFLSAAVFVMIAVAARRAFFIPPTKAPKSWTATLWQLVATAAVAVAYAPGTWTESVLLSAGGWQWPIGHASSLLLFLAIALYTWYAQTLDGPTTVLWVGSVTVASTLPWPLVTLALTAIFSTTVVFSVVAGW